ncbi:MAG: solute carrier family 26 protein [Bacteroidota bacterium]
MKTYFPFLSWIPAYKRENLSGDISAGLTVGIMLIPQGMAYAMLAGLPPIYGLYASTLPLIVYALFGTSPQLAVGPVAMDSLLVASGVSTLADPGSEQYISLVILLALMVGIIQLSMGLLRLGFLVNFLSHPVLAGFTSAAALIIASSQLTHLLGVDIPRLKVHETLLLVGQKAGAINLPTLLLGLLGIGILLFLKKLKKRIPGPLVIVIMGILLVYGLSLSEQGVKIVADIPAGLPSISTPNIHLENARQLIPIAFTIAFIGFMESIAISKALENKHKTHEVKPNQELIALGLANSLGSFLKSFPVTGGFSRSAVNAQAGANSGLASLISAGVIILTLLFLTPLFYYLPKAVLAAIIMAAVLGLVNIKEAIHLWKTDKRDFFLFLFTATATLVLGIKEGIMLGVALSIFMVIYRISYPHIAILGRIPQSNDYRNIHRFDKLTTYQHIFIFRFDAQLYFANTAYFKNFLLSNTQANPDIKHVILDASAINTIDSSAINMLQDVMASLQQEGITLYMVEVKGPIRDTLTKNGILQEENRELFFMTVQNAVDYIEEGVVKNKETYILQSNHS